MTPREPGYPWPDLDAIRAEARAAGFRAALDDVRRECGVEHDDPRIGYVTVQISRPMWDELNLPGLADRLGERTEGSGEG